MEKEEDLEEKGYEESLLIVLSSYLSVYELLMMAQVCKSFRDAVKNDILPWLNIVVDKPLNKRFTDYYLFQLTSKACGRLTTLALFNCSNITDHAVLHVAASNPHLTSLCLPGCTTLTPNGVIEAVQLLNKNNHQLKRLMINGIHNIKSEHLQVLHDLMGDQRNAEPKKKGSNFYHVFKSYQTLKHIKTNNAILDVDLCPKCHEVGMVFDCPRESCRKMKQVECRGCSICITRCEECGVCIGRDDDEGEETACGETLCLACWLLLTKCSFCNKPYCSHHSYKQCFLPAVSTGWICVACQENLNEVHNDSD